MRTARAESTVLLVHPHEVVVPAFGRAPRHLLLQPVLRLASRHTQHGHVLYSQKGGYHRECTLAIPSSAPDGGPLVDPAVGTLELTIRDVAGVRQRRLKWSQNTSNQAT